jgi:protein-S-isoprenylcysteine O-methyltransferase Ste14
MSKRSFVEKKRKLFSRLFAVALAVLILISRSGWEPYGLISDYMFLIGLALAGIATVGRLWCSLYICGYKTNKLISVGPYSLCRNPLYFFSFIGGIGVGLASETLTVTFIIFVAFVLYYPFMIKAEERKLREIHNHDFEKYLERTPRFWPSFALLNEPEEYSVKPKLFRKRVFDALWFVWLIGIMEIIEALHEWGVIPILFKLY